MTNMVLGIISDTHIPSRSIFLPKKIFTVFKGVDLILHAGDIESEKVLTELSSLAPVEAVAGNMDGLLFLPHRRSLVLNQHKIGLIHGAGGLRSQVRDYIRKEFKQAELIVYGHTHQPFWGEENGIKFMNPGTALSGPSGAGTVGILELKPDYIHGEIVSL